MIKKILALGKELDLAVPLPDEITATEALAVVREHDPETARYLDSVAHSTRVEGNTLVFYRLGAIFG